MTDPTPYEKPSVEEIEADGPITTSPGSSQLLPP
jgi:hypothetical protein